MKKILLIAMLYTGLAHAQFENIPNFDSKVYTLEDLQELISAEQKAAMYLMAKDFNKFKSKYKDTIKDLQGPLDASEVGKMFVVNFFIREGLFANFNSNGNYTEK